VVAFARDHPIAYILGGHIELDASGQAFPWESHYHPHEHVLQMTRADLLELPAVLADFNGFYTERGSFIMENSIRILIAVAVGALLILVTLVSALVVYFRRRKAVRGARAIDARSD
jgi:hypothetical protein